MSFSTDDELTVLPTPGPQPDGTKAGAPRFGVGQALGAHRIERLLVRGGMDEVYEAAHFEHGRRIALKVLNQRLAGADDRARFLREGQFAASLQVAADSSLFVRRHSCGGRLWARAQVKHVRRSHGSRPWRKSTCIGHTSQYSCIVYGFRARP